MAIAVTAGALLPVAAEAQEQPSPLRFLKPWIERRLGLSPTPQPPPDAPTAPAAAPGGMEMDAASGDTSEASRAAVSLGSEAEGPPILRGSDGQATPLPPAATEAEETATLPLPPPSDAPSAQADPEVARPPPPPQPLRLAIIAGRSAAATLAATATIPERLSAILGRPVELLPVSSYGAMIDAQVQRRIDGGFYTAAAFATAEASCRCLDPIVAPRAADGAVAYHAIVVAGEGSGIAAAADLAGRTIAVGSGDSLASRRMQLAGLLADGVDPAAFGEVITVASPLEALRLVVDGRADAAFSWSSLAGDAEQGYSRGPLAELVARGELEMGEISIAWRSPAIPHGPVAVLASLPDAEKRRIESYFIGLESAQPAAYDALNPIYAGGYTAVDAQDYAGLSVLTTQDVDVVALPSEITPPGD